jgi:hypothetical protein
LFLIPDELQKSKWVRSDFPPDKPLHGGRAVEVTFSLAVTGVYREFWDVYFLKVNRQRQCACLWQQTRLIRAGLKSHMNRKFDFPIINGTALAHQFAHGVKRCGEVNGTAPHTQIDIQCF